MRPSALDPKALSPEQRFILTAMRIANGTCGADDLRRVAEADMDWDAIVAGLECHGLLRLTNIMLDVAGIVPAVAEADIKQRAAGSAFATFLRIGETVTIARAFDVAGLRYLMIKGVPLSVQLYQDPARRSGRDVDVLVAPEDMASADTIMRTLGYERPDEDKAKDSIAGHKAKELGYLHQVHRTLVEVHDRLTDNAALLPWDFEALWAEREQVIIGPAQVPTMNYARLALYLSVHGTKHCWSRLMWLGDIIALTPTAEAADAALVEARTIGAEGVMTHTFAMLDAWFGHAVLTARPAPTRQVRWMNALTMHFHRDPMWYTSAPRGSWRRFWQNSVLSRSMAYVMKRGWRYRLGQMEIELSSPADRAMLALPPRLVWLYPFFRPFGWIVRRLKRDHGGIMTWRIQQRAKTFAQMGLRRHALLAEAAFMLLVARIWLLIRPFSRIAPKLGRLSDTGAKECIERPLPQLDSAKAIGEAVRLAARLVPFRSLCLQQGVAAKLMLRRRGIMGTLHFGVVIDEDGAQSIQSHAWLNVDSVGVTGYPVPPHYTEIGKFN